VGSPVTRRAPATMAHATAAASSEIGAERTSAARPEICRLRSSSVVTRRRCTPERASSAAVLSGASSGPTPRSASVTIEWASPASGRAARTATRPAHSTVAATARSNTVPLPTPVTQPGNASEITASAMSGGRAVARRAASRRSDGRPLAIALPPLRRRHQAIADATLREQETRSVRIGLKLSAEAADSHPYV
jgi:hypothetical protein